MASSSGLFPAVKELNKYQKNAITFFASKGLTTAHFVNRDWFCALDHYRAFTFLVVKQQRTIDDAFSILDQLDKYQACGICLGLSREEVLDLGWAQIQTLLRYNLPKSDLQDLNDFQFDALLALKKHGLQAADIRGQDWFKRAEQLEALIYLVTIKQIAIAEALSQLNEVKELKRMGALAISYGFNKDDIVGLEKDLIKILVEQKQYDGLRTRHELSGLSSNQIEMVKKLYRFGLTSELVKKLPDNEAIKDALSRIVTVRGISILDAINLLDGLNEAQADGVAFGLEKQDVVDLNKSQISALLRCKTIKNGLSRADLLDKDWFNSSNHVDALYTLLMDKLFTVKEAMAELDGLDSRQAWQIATGKRGRDDIVGFTKWQLAALEDDELNEAGLRGHHLRGKDWFNSEIHLNMLKIKYCCAGMDVDKAVAEQEGFNVEQVSLLYLYTREEIVSMNPIQFSILLQPNTGYGINADEHLILEANWLQTKEQGELLKALKGASGIRGVLALTKKLSETPNGISELLEKIQGGRISRYELYDLGCNAEREAYAATHPTASSGQSGWRCAIL